MATPFNLTDQVVTATGAIAQEAWDALDIGNFDMIDVQLDLVALAGSGPSVSIQLEGSMQNSSSDNTNWVLVGSASAPTWSGLGSSQVGFQPVVIINMGLLRYLRWHITSLTGTSVSFTIRGMGRRYGS